MKNNKFVTFTVLILAVIGLGIAGYLLGYKYLKSCPSRSKLGCNSVQYVKSDCILGVCKCKCDTKTYEEYGLPQPIFKEELTYKEKTYVKTEKEYKKAIPEDYQVKLRQGVTIYDYKGDIYTLKTADPHHGSYIYTKWQPKSTNEEEVFNWKAYINEKYDFRFEYPSGWTVWRTNKKGIELDPLGDTRSVAGAQTGTDDVSIYAKQLPAYFSKTKVKTFEEFDRWLNKQITKNHFSEKKKMTLGVEDYKGVKLTSLSKYQNKIIFLKNKTGPFIYRIELPSYYESNEEKTYSRMVSTFEFVDSKE